MDYAALDAWILGDESAGFLTAEEEDIENEIRDRRRAREEAEDARACDDPAEMLEWMLANCRPNDPAIPIWRAEVERRNTLTLGV